MKIIYGLIVIVVGVPLLLFGSIFAASELGGEVVTLQRVEDNGDVSQIRIWIVDDGDTAYIEHGAPDAYWMRQLAASRSITLSRNGQAQQFVATAAPESHQLYHDLRRQKYTWADQFIGLFSGGEHNCGGVPVKLSPSGAVSESSP